MKYEEMKQLLKQKRKVLLEKRKKLEDINTKIKLSEKVYIEKD